MKNKENKDSQDSQVVVVNIPKNKYKPDYTLRDEIVQDICDAFLSGAVWHTHVDNYKCECKIFKYKTVAGKTRYEFRTEDKEGTLFTEVEMRAAFKALLKAGYHMFSGGYYVEYFHYVCSEKDYMVDNNYKYVEDFTERWT